MQNVLKKKLEDLGKEASALVKRREQLIGMIQEIEVRLHQISGAITELDSLSKSMESKDEASKID